jgi:hypothetical protein
VTRETSFHQPKGNGDPMVLVWEGVDQEGGLVGMSSIVQNPQTDHERYIVSPVIANLHGVDPTAGPPPRLDEVSVVAT